MIRAMTEQDYDRVYALWKSIKGFGMRTVDDTRENICAFLARNEGLSAVAEQDGEIIGAILCGHDGRTGSFYHVCVRDDFRRHGICTQMTDFCVNALKEAGITRIQLIAFITNEAGNAYWQRLGWKKRDDANFYSLDLNPDNVTHFNV